MRLSFKSAETSRDMGYVLRQERSLAQQQNPNAVKEKISSPWTEMGVSFQDKHKVRHSFSLPYSDPKCELRQNARAEKVVRSKSSESDQKPRSSGRACDDNELVKHMSNLPGFLLKVEKDNTIQEKALNFGVLDWKRLEKWKYTERMPGKLPKRSTGNPSATVPPKLVPNLRKLPSSHNRNPSSSYVAKQPMLHGSHFSSHQRQPSPPPSSHLNFSKDEKNGSYTMEDEKVESIKSKGKETCNQEYQGAESFRIGRQQNHFQQRVELYDRSCSGTNVLDSKRKDLEKEMMSEKEVSSSSSKQGKHKISLLSPNKISARGEKNEMRFDELKQTSESCPADPQNILPQVPKLFHENNLSKITHSTEFRTSLDLQFSEFTENRVSDFFSQDFYSGEISADIPHSCPLTSGDVGPHNLLSSEAIDVDICPSADPVTSISSEAKCSAMKEKTARPSTLVEAYRKQADIAQQASVKTRSPSPTRRFNFNLGRMSRSFSFKESSGTPQLSSTYTTVKSGPVRPDVAPGLEKFERDQANASSRGRSSPLRRLLDPLLKHKTTTETVRPSNGSARSMSVSTTGPQGPSQDRKPEVSTFQALLQLTFKNGLPFFKLVVENSKDMLAAAVKRLPTSGKNDPCMIYSFYSVHEIRKKSMNWITHGSKSKNNSLGYNIVGQMKISNSYHLKVNAGDTSDCDVRECVLYGVDPTQVDKQILEFVPNKEIAAIVVKNSIGKVDDQELRDKNHLFAGREFPQCSNATAVILPGGVHGMPIKGAPSTLINRWRSGGSCDCGGWDMGCKLRILAESGNSNNTMQESISSSTNHINLYMQGGEKTSKPVLSLKPFSSGLYSIDLDASVSLLEAFATSVAYVTCWKFPEIIETEGQSVAHPESGRWKTLDTFQEQIPAKFVTCPPLSPAGRI